MQTIKKGFRKIRDSVGASVTNVESLFYYPENYVSIVPELSSNSIEWRIFLWGYITTHPSTQYLMNDFL